MSTRKFKTSVMAQGSRVFVPIPFDPNEVWGTKQRHYVTGTIYRNTYIKWIEGAKRPETRAARIAEMISLLRAGEKQK